MVENKQDKKKSSESNESATKKRTSARKAQKMADVSIEEESAEVPKPSGPPLNKAGNPLGSITRTDIVSAVPNLAEPNSALTNFRTRKR